MHINNILKGICLSAVFSYVKGQANVQYESVNSELKELTIEVNENGEIDFSILKDSDVSKLEVSCGNVSDGEGIIAPNTLSTLSETLTELKLEFCKINENEDLSPLTNLKSVYIGGFIDNLFPEKLSVLSSLEEVSFMYAVNGIDELELEFSALKNAPKLTTLQLMSGQVQSKELLIPDGSLEVFKNLKKLVLQSVSLTKNNFDEITRMENIEELGFHGVGRLGEEEDELYYNVLVNLKDQLTGLEFSFPKRTPGSSFEKIPEFIFSLTNLKKLTINDCQSIETVTEKIKELKNLEYLDVYNTRISLDEILGYLDDLKNLQQIEAGRLNRHQNWSKADEEEPTEDVEPTQDVEPTEDEYQCSKADALGYPCCSHCHSIYEDKNGLWGAEHGKWCVIPDQCQAKYEECWSIKKGYPCCDNCKVHTVDKSGSWGIMNKNWCGIPTSC